MMPRLLWKDGITSLSELSAKYKIGIMFTIVIVSLQDAGKVLLEEVLGSNKRLNDMRQVFQMMLILGMAQKGNILGPWRSRCTRGCTHSH